MRPVDTFCVMELSKTRAIAATQVSTAVAVVYCKGKDRRR